jgi:hypothetical protein
VATEEMAADNDEELDVFMEDEGFLDADEDPEQADADISDGDIGPEHGGDFD